MQKLCFSNSSQEVDYSCSNLLDQSQTVMQLRYGKAYVCERNHCLPPYISSLSLAMNTSQLKSSNLHTSNSSVNTVDLANNTLEQANFLNFVENFSTSSPSFRAPIHQRYAPSMSGSANQPTRIDMIRARNKARLRHSKDHFVFARGQTT